MSSPGVFLYNPPVVKVFGAAQAAATSANTVHADTGAILSGGDYHFVIHLSNDSASEVQYAIQHRDSANSSTVAELRVSVSSGQALQIDAWFSLAANARVRVLNLEAIGAATGTAGDSQAAIFGFRF